MRTRYKIIGVIILIIVSYAFGRYSAPAKVTEEDKTKIIDKGKTDKTTDINKSTHKETKTEVVTNPDGTKKETTTVTEDTNANVNKNTSIVNNKTTTEDKTKETISNTNKTTLSALAGTNVLHFGDFTPVYGGHVTHEVLGPISVGAFGLTNGTAGVSVGLSF